MNGIHFRKHADEGVPLVPISYQFVKPTQMRVRFPGGSTQLIGYGIGDIIQVLEPETQWLIGYSSRDRLTEIPLANGSTIIEFPEDIPVQILGS